MEVGFQVMSTNRIQTNRMPSAEAQRWGAG